MRASSILHPIPSSSSSYPPLISSLFHKLHSLNPQSIKPIQSQSQSQSPLPNPSISSKTLHKPKPPLFLHPPIYSTQSSNLQSFITWAKNLISSQSPNFTDLDPITLHRELKWFLEDAVETPITQSTQQNPRIEGEIVKLRVKLEEMYELWESRMVKRRPFQYIVGCEHWRDLVLSVEEGVLIPRPETGQIVDLVDGLGLGLEKGGVWGDLGCGSGALSIGISRVLGRDSRVIGVDVSDVAVSVARYNVQRYELQDIVDIRKGSWFEPIMEFEGQLSGLVSNPPYIPSKDMDGLQSEVGKHEPWLALDGGVDGLDYLSYLCSKTSSMLKPGGFFAFETNGEEQCKILGDYLENRSGGSICNVEIVSDFYGIPRFVTGRRSETR